MSLASFQSCLARLITDPDYRDRVRAVGAAASERGLTERECARLCTIAQDKGVDVNRTLHKGFRLGKLRAMLPLTCQLLGSKRLALHVAAFWKNCPPSSFYFIPEALEFCDFLEGRRLRVKYLAEVMAYERANLEIEKASTGAPPPQRVLFQHDPRVLLAALANGRRPRAVPLCPKLAIAERDDRGRIHWQLIDGIENDAVTAGVAQA